MRLLFFAITLLALSGSTAAEPPPLPLPSQTVDLQRYAGDWHVQGCIPLRIPFFSDAEARNYTERFELLGPDAIRMTSAFDDGQQQAAKRRSFSFNGNIVDTVQNATWKIWLLWPISAKYSIVYLDETYTTTIIASANRRLAWIMSREPQISDAQYTMLIGFLTEAGFDPRKFRRIPNDSQQTARLH